MHPKVGLRLVQDQECAVRVVCQFAATRASDRELARTPGQDRGSRRQSHLGVLGAGLRADSRRAPSQHRTAFCEPSAPGTGAGGSGSRNIAMPGNVRVNEWIVPPVKAASDDGLPTGMGASQADRGGHSLGPSPSRTRRRHLAAIRRIVWRSALRGEGSDRETGKPFCKLLQDSLVEVRVSMAGE